MDAGQSNVNAGVLRLAMRRWTTGVTIVTSRFGDVQHGMTVSSFTSVSLEPPLVLVSLERTTRTHQLVEAAGIYAVTILAEGQSDLSDCFAGRHSQCQDRFQHSESFTLVTGAPMFSGSLAVFDCRVTAAYATGTHTLFIAQVVAARVGDQTKPLLYFDRQYHKLN